MHFSIFGASLTWALCNEPMLNVRYVKKGDNAYEQLTFFFAIWAKMGPQYSLFVVKCV